MTVFDMLEEDHEKVAGLLERLEETTERAIKTRQTGFAKLNEDLTLHARIEETFFYPALRDKEKTQAITLKAYETHGVIKNLLGELSALSVESPEWTAKLTVLKDTVEQHVAEEEHEIFKSARQVLTKKEIDALGEEVANARRKPEEFSGPADAPRGTAAAGRYASEPLRSVAAATGSFCSSCQTLVGNLFQSVCGQTQHRRG